MSPTRAICLSVTVISVFTLVLLGRPFSFITPRVEAQASSQLVPLVTDQTPLALSNVFGGARQTAINHAGDFAFVGTSASAIFYRSAGAGAPVRVMQMGDEVPGYPGSRADIMQTLGLNNSGLLVFQVELSQANGVSQSIIFTFDGTSFNRIVAGDDAAPGGGGVNFGRPSLFGLNDSGDVAFTAGLVPSGSFLPAQTTLYIAPGGGAPVRLVGLGDTAPGTGGTFGTLGQIFPPNNLGEVLFRPGIAGGSGGSGLFVASTAGVRKVFAPGDLAPGGGLLPNPGAVFINNAGQVVFQAGNNIYVNTLAAGTSRAVGIGDAAPLPVGGTFGSVILQNLGDGGDIAFISGLAAPATTTVGLFRFRPSNPTEAVAYRNQAAPGAPGESFGPGVLPFTAISINSTGVISFRATLTGGPILNGVFQQTGSNPPVNISLDGEATTLSGGGSYFATNTPTRTLANGAVYFRADVVGGTADSAEVLSSGGTPTILMSTADTLPVGARVVFRTFRVGAAGDFVGFLAQRTGGRLSIAVHNIATQATNVLASDGDAAPGTGGGTLRLATLNTVFPNAGGTVVFNAQITGGSAPGTTGIFLSTPGSGLTKVVAIGDVAPGTGGKTFSGATVSTVTPSAINDAGQVVFSANLVPAPTTRGVFVWSPGTGLSKVAAVGDVTSSGGTITGLSSGNAFSINSLGQVAFLATTAVGPAPLFGIYVGSPGGTPAKVVAPGDPGPSGSTFAGFPSATSFFAPGFNDLGEVAFMATLTGAPGGGVFIGSNSGPPVPLVLNGDPAPSGGNFSITTARPDVLINNQQDVAFRGDLTGGPANSGYFIRRGSLGTLQAVVLQGDPAPGTPGGVFDTIVPSINNLVSENFQLGPDGDLAFQNFFLAGGQRTLGVWHVKTDNVVEEILVRGIVEPEFGGGSAVTSTPSTAWNSGGRYPVWARISGGTFTDGIFLFVPVVSTNTPAGTTVPVTMTDSTTGTTPVDLTFASVTTAGETTLTTSSGGPAIPTAFSLGDPPVFYNIETTATFTGSIDVCIDFSNISFPPGSTLRLLHYEGGVWVDVTTSGPTGNIICGNVTSLSPFTVVQVLDNTPPSLTVTLSPNSIWPANQRMVNISASIQVSDDFDPSPQVQLVSITCNETLGSGDIQGATFNTDDREFELRATRAGNGPGRIYTVTYQATDVNGNTVLKTAQVIVPHDQGQ